jgi:hypothetical protein
MTDRSAHLRRLLESFAGRRLDCPADELIWQAHARDSVELSLYTHIRDEGWLAFCEGGLMGLRVLGQAACGDNKQLSTILGAHWEEIGNSDG